MTTKSLYSIEGTYGASVPCNYGRELQFSDVDTIQRLIDTVLIPDAKHTLAAAFPEESEFVIEIRGAIDDGIFKEGGGDMTRIAWLYCDGTSAMNPKSDGLLFEFDGKLEPRGANNYYNVACLKIEIENE